MANIVLGPLLRHVGQDDATVWVETDSACEIEVLGRRTRTFHVAGHHYALVVIAGLAPGSHPYEVRLDGQLRWPEPGSPYPASQIRTIAATRPLRLAFGSCRVAAPHGPPYSLPRARHRQGHGPDALVALAFHMTSQSEADWPDALLLLGDQVYADAASPGTRAFIRARRDTRRPHGEEVSNFEEYTQLYREAWGDPPIRWLLSTLPTAMIFDDHDVHDDWNTSAAWRREMHARPWWDERISGAFATYWLYQHLGNMSLGELERDPLYARLRAADDGAADLLAFGLEADREPSRSRWSYRRDLGPARLVVIDSRAGRVLSDEHREMVDDAEWAWLDGQLRGDVQHLLIATSLPYLLPPAIHALEAWNEAVCAGAWGTVAARLGEWLRRGLDLEHWAAFSGSFRRLADVITSIAAGRRGRAPASIVILSGDVHSSYVARARLAGREQISAVYQVVCSPLRNEPTGEIVHAQQLGWSPRATRIARALARAAGVRSAPVQWSLAGGPVFHNALGMLVLAEPEMTIRIEQVTVDARGLPRLEPVCDLCEELSDEPGGPQILPASA